METCKYFCCQKEATYDLFDLSDSLFCSVCDDDMDSFTKEAGTPDCTTAYIKEIRRRIPSQHTATDHSFQMAA